MEVMNYIKDTDVAHKPKIISGYPHYSTPYLNSMGTHATHTDELGYIVRPQMDNLNLNPGFGDLGSQDSIASPHGSHVAVANCLRTNDGGEDYFRSTNVF